MALALRAPHHDRLGREEVGGPVAQWAKAVSTCNGEPQPQSEQDPEKRVSRCSQDVPGARGHATSNGQGLAAGDLEHPFWWVKPQACRTT